MKNPFRLFIAAVALCALYSACNNPDKNKTEKNNAGQPTGTSVSVPVFNEDTAFFFVKMQTDFGPRVPNTAAHANCALWLEETLKKYSISAILSLMDFSFPILYLLFTHIKVPIFIIIILY